VHHTQVHDRTDISRAKDVLRLTAADVDLVMDDVLGLTVEAPPIDPDHLPFAMQLAREQLAHATTDARDHDGATLDVRSLRLDADRSLSRPVA
jgi:hypothetical protein